MRKKQTKGCGYWGREHQVTWKVLIQSMRQWCRKSGEELVIKRNKKGHPVSVNGVKPGKNRHPWQ